MGAVYSLKEIHEKAMLENTDTGISDFELGAIEMMHETLYALNDFATACAGLGSERMSPEEMFDRVARNLAAYYNQVLQRKEFDET